MEVILITPNPKYETLVQPNKIIQSNNVDLVALIETEVFLNHHYNISFYCIKNNFPYQFHCPLKISKHLLDRNEGAVELSISNGLHFKIQQDTDTMDILSNVQTSLQGVQSQQNVIFTLKFWEIQIRLYILNEIPQENRIKQSINQIEDKIKANKGSTISKIILYIDDTNYEDFLSWSENQGDFFDFQLHEKLSHQYLSLKQQIDNEKNSFRNKIKMVEAILGQNINIDKLLSEQKQQNQEYKRLRETFETIKNIDNVLIDQQKKLESRTNQLKQKRAEKHRTQYQNAKMFVKKKAQISQLIKEVEQLKYNVKRVTEVKEKFNSKRNFECSTKVKGILQSSVNKYRNIVNHMFQSNSVKKNEAKGEDNRGKIFASLHKSENKRKEDYQNLLKNRVENYQKKNEQENESEKIHKNLESELKVFQDLLSKIAKFCQKNNEIAQQTKRRLKFCRKSADCVISPSQRKESPPQFSKISFTLPKNFQWNEQQFVVLNEINQKKHDYNNYTSNNKQNMSKIGTNTMIDSRMSIKFNVEEDKNRNSGVSIENTNANGVLFYGKAAKTKLFKSKINFNYEERKTVQTRY